VSGHVRRSRRARLLVALSLIALAGLAPQPASASATGTENINLVLPTGIQVSGAVTGPNDEVVEESFAGLCDLEGGCFVADAAADETGAYVIGKVEPGTYTVMAGGEGFVSVWLGPDDSSVTDFSQAVTVDVSGDMTLPTLHLAAGFSIAGTLTDPDGHGVAGAEVLVNGDAGGGATTTDADGGYLMTGLGGGFYSIDVLPPLGSPFQGGTINSGGTIDKQDYNPWVEVDGDETGVDATLAVGRSISGTITGLAGPADVNVSGTPFGRAVPVAEDGTFNAAGLWADELQTLVVTVRTTGDDGQFPYGVYDGTSNLNPDQNATAEIDVSAGDVTGLTLAAPNLPKISGTVLDELDAAVPGWVSLCSDDLGCANKAIEGDGSYELINLPDSTYRMYVVTFDHVQGFVTAGGGVSPDFEDAAGIVVAGSDQVVNVVAPVGMTISGTITGPEGEPVVGGNVSASRPDGGFLGAATTDATGSYVIGGLTPGDYRVYVNGPEGGNYFSGYWSESGYTADYEASSLVHVPSDGVTVVSTTPEDGATGVARTVRPSVTFSASVDVSAAVVSLSGGRMPVAMLGTISYEDATHTLGFIPRGRLLPLSTYVFEVSGLTAGGAPVEPVSVTFTTRR
jgi:hypothetical protein